jgi:hypothetical protein
MKKLLLTLSLVFLLFSNSFSQSWSQVPGYQISYGDVLGVTRFQGNIWVETTSGIYKIVGSNWQLTSSGFNVALNKGCMYTDGTDLYAGGFFDFNTYKAILLRWDGAQWLPIVFVQNLVSGVWIETILKTPLRLYFGGSFDYISLSNGSFQYLPYFAFIENSNCSQLFNITVPGCGSGVKDIRLIGDSIYVAGGFSQIGTTWSPGTFRFKEGGGVTTLDNYGFCNLAGNYQIYQGSLYVSGRRHSDNISADLGLSKRVGNTWISNINQIQITQTKAVVLLGRLFVAGVATGAPIGSFVPVICSYDGTNVINEGFGISTPPNPFSYIPEASVLFADTIENKLYVAGNFNRLKGDVADNFAVRNVYFLPVNLSSFTAQALVGGSVKLDWRDETPEDGVRFDVQMSTDGRSFKSISQLIGKANKNDYSFVFPNNGCGKFYFRLAFEGKYSEIKMINIACDVNIISDGKTLRIQTKHSGTLTLTNTAGQTLARTVLANGYRNITLSYPPGVYIASFVDQKGNTYNQKILVQ